MDRYDPREATNLRHAGTFNNNICSMMAGLAGFTRVFTAEKAKEFMVANGKVPPQFERGTFRQASSDAIHRTWFDVHRPFHPRASDHAARYPAGQPANRTDFPHGMPTERSVACIARCVFCRARRHPSATTTHCATSFACSRKRMNRCCAARPLRHARCNTRNVSSADDVTNGIIDVHHHPATSLSGGNRRASWAAGSARSAAQWSPALSIEAMDLNGIGAR